MFCLGRDGERAELTTTFAARVLKVLDNGQCVIGDILKTKTSSRVVDSERLVAYTPRNINLMNGVYLAGPIINSQSVSHNQKLLCSGGGRSKSKFENRLGFSENFDFPPVTTRS